MKKFKFSLDTVLGYKKQLLETHQNEYAASTAAVRQQEELLHFADERYCEYNEEYRQRKCDGLTITDASIYQMGLRVMEAEIQAGQVRLEQLQQIAEEKRQWMVETKREIASIETLREKRLDTYEKAWQKAEENLIDEFVGAARFSKTTA